MLVNKASLIRMREGEELKAPRHASAAATRDGNLPSRDGNLPYSRHWQNLVEVDQAGRIRQNSVKRRFLLKRSFW